MKKNENIIILHGIANLSLVMKKLEDHFNKQGYNVLNIDYPSTSKPLDEIADVIHPQIKKLTQNGCTTHFITYSMGGLVTRTYINKHKPKNLGRVCMIAPPNNGSEIADFLKNIPVYKWIFGPAGQQLTTNQEDVKALFGNVDYELGIIAGTRCLDPISALIFNHRGQRLHDGKVSVESTKLDGMRDHITVEAEHTFIMRNKTVIQQAEHFLNSGNFNHHEQ